MNVNVKLLQIKPDKSLITSENITTDRIMISNNKFNVLPKNFIVKDFEIIQISDKIFITSIDKYNKRIDEYKYTITQNPSRILTIRSVFRSFDSIVLSMTNGICKIVNIYKILKDVEYFDNNFIDCLEISSNNKVVADFFKTDYGFIGYIDKDNGIYIRKKSLFKRLPIENASNITIDNLYSKIYYSNGSILQVYNLKTDIIDTISFNGETITNTQLSYYNTIVVFTDNGIYSIYNNRVHKIRKEYYRKRNKSNLIYYNLIDV